MSASLTIYEYRGRRVWEEWLPGALPAEYQRCRKSAAWQVWSTAGKVAVGQVAGLSFCDGWKIFRVAVVQNKVTLAVIPHRYYFEGDNPEPSSKTERALLGRTTPRALPPTVRLQGCLNLANQIAATSPDFTATPLPILVCRQNLHAKTSVLLGGGEKIIAGQKVGAFLGRHGYFQVPTTFRVVLVAQDVNAASVQHYAQEITSTLTRCRLSAPVNAMSCDQLLERIARGTALRSGWAYLIAVSGSRGEQLPSGVQPLLVAMDKNRIPYRLFSADNAAMNWSAFDQLGSLVAAAGGIPYVLGLPWPAEQPPAFFLGVDVGHPLQLRESWITLSLADHRGIHIQSWRCRQKRDETISDKALTAALTWAKGLIDSPNSPASGRVVALRDGRLHKGEQLRTYQEILGPRMTFVEFSKYQNPEMFITGETPRPATAGTECQFANSTVRFITPISPRLAGDLSRTFKVRLEPEWDGLQFGMDCICEVIVGLSYAPGLGLQPHALPGPIYWADGIAAISETNHQFSGQNIVHYPPGAAC